MPVTVWPALAMAVLAAANVALMAWLWRFPMAPDPTGRNPHGVSTAPRSWTALHRWIGYAFGVAYAVLLVEMAPRLWTHAEWTAVGVTHAVLGGLVGVLLVGKVVILRQFRRFEPRMPWIGGALAVATWATVALGAAPLWMVIRPLDALPPEASGGRPLVAARCLQCHGASVLAAEHEDADEWDDVTEDMQENAQERPGATPITEAERRQIVAFLVATRGDEDDARDDDRDRRDDRRGRGRGRGGRDH